MIDGVKLKQLQVNCDERGYLFEILRSDDDVFTQFGQVYLTAAYPGVVKAWHMHGQQVDNMCVVAGHAKLVLYDARENSATYGEIDELFPGVDNRILVQIPPGVYHGFKNIGTSEVLVLNIPDKPYAHGMPDEYRLEPHAKKIPYDWARRDG